MRESCSLDAAEKGRHTTAEVGHVLGISRQHVRNELASATAKLTQSEEGRDLLEALDD